MRKDNDCVTHKCGNCIFFEEIKDMGCSSQSCTVIKNGNGMYGVGKDLKWVSANDYKRDSRLAEKHDSDCECFVSLEDVKEKYRKVFSKSM